MLKHHTLVESVAGSVSVTIALVMPVLIGMAGLSVDASYWLKEKRNLQTAADAAALAGAFELANNRSVGDAKDAALQEAKNNGYKTGATNSLQTFIETDVEGNQTVRVEMKQAVDLWFAKLFINSARVGSRAVARVDGTDGPFCFLSLDPYADGAIQVSGSVEVHANACGIANNSNSDSALHLWGSVFVDVGDVKIVGDYVTGGASDFFYKTLRTGASKTKDPYEKLSITPDKTCTNAQQKNGTTKISGSGTVNLNPGTYCGGISITGNNNIKLAPGTYYIDGGDFSVSGGGSITGENVTIVLTNSGGTSYGTYGNLDVAGGKEMYFKAPTTGTYAGLAIVQDRKAPPVSANKQNKLTGTSGLTIDGVIYTPSRGITFGGNEASYTLPGGNCSKIIANTITFAGNPYLGNNCENKATKPIGTPAVKLIE